MEHRTEEGNPPLKLRSSIITRHKHWYMSYNKSDKPLSDALQQDYYIECYYITEKKENVPMRAPMLCDKIDEFLTMLI